MKKLIRIIAAIASFVLLVAVAVPSASAITRGIEVTVRNGQGHAIPNALVQFLRSTNPAGGQVHTFRTDIRGVAMFLNATAGTYGINVTHPDFASTHATSHQITLGTGVNEVQRVTTVMNQPHFRSLNWAPILANMGTPANPAYRISSVYGWREWAGNPMHRHLGIDIVSNVYPSVGRGVNTPFSGTVVQVFTNPNGSAGFGITLRYHDPSVQSDFYVRHFHLQSLPARADGTQLVVSNQVTRGEQVGRLGATPPGTSAHLHTDVHRNHDLRRLGSSWAHTIDPRAFFAPGFVEPWRGLNIRN